MENLQSDETDACRESCWRPRRSWKNGHVNHRKWVSVSERNDTKYLKVSWNAVVEVEDTC